MSTEAKRYFTQRDCDFRQYLPPECTWQEMIRTGEVIEPETLIKILLLAKNFLITAPGPNRAARSELVPPWYDQWWRLILDSQPEKKKLRPFTQVKPYLTENSLVDHSGVLFVAGAEGHEGHLHAASYMKENVLCTILAFEQDSYFTIVGKERGAPFLPLEVRLSMWHYSPSVDLLTVLPERMLGVPEDEHYQALFEQLGARYCFAEAIDPNCEEKIARGEKVSFLVIPHLPVAPTTDRVEHLFPESEPLESTAEITKLIALLTPPRNDSFFRI
jgi:hypothetical protein